MLASGCVVIAAYIDVIDFTVLLLPLLLLLFLFAVVVAAFLLWFACYCCLSLKMMLSARLVSFGFMVLPALLRSIHLLTALHVRLRILRYLVG